MLLDPGVPPLVSKRRPLLDVADVPNVIRDYVRGGLTHERTALSGARGRVLAADVLAPMPLPPFDHAAVDGYALPQDRLGTIGEPIPIDGRIRAGDPASPAGGGALRILTGAPIPEGMAAVVMQEHVGRSANAIHLAEPVRRGANIRRVGEDVAAGEVILRAGRPLETPQIALLAALGIDDIAVFRRPSVAILALGNELVAPGDTRAAHQIYDSNSAMAAAFFARHGCEVRAVERLPDDPRTIREAMAALAGSVDLLVTSGGMADGDEDHTRQTLIALGGTWRTLGIKMKPGKPVSFGDISGTTVLGLPGNPFAALVGLIVVGHPILAALDSRNAPEAGFSACAGFALDRTPGRAEFFPAVRANRATEALTIDRLGKGGSARLKPLAHADGLGFIESNVSCIRRGDRIVYHPFSTLF